jgi:HlyD family secretion protein
MSIGNHVSETRRTSRMKLCSIALAALFAAGCSPEDGGREVPAAMTVTVRTLDATQVARTVTANGTVHPWQEVIVGAEVGGYRVAAVNVDVGDRVKQGQELARLADDLLSADVSSKRANVQQAQATFENAAAAHRRAVSLSVSAALSQSDVDRLRSEELAARARVVVAQADLDAAELRLRYTRVTAQDDGIISSRTVAVGQIAQVGAEMFRMVRKGRVEWRAEIPEARMREIKIGQTVRLTMADGVSVSGKVRTISPTIESSTRAGLVYVDISGVSVRPGMFARGEIVLDRTEANMTPIASVVIQDGYNYVFVLKDDNTVERRHVETGLVQGDLIEIVSGVEMRERIVEKGAGFLKDGDRVNVVAGPVGKSS